MTISLFKRKNDVAKMLSVLRAFGTDAHLYLPGVGVISGVTAGNYLDSIGANQATVDGNVGLVLDGAGSIGAELAGLSTAWSSYGAGISLSAGKMVFAATPAGQFAMRGTPLGAGKTYQLELTIDSISGGGIQMLVGGGAGTVTATTPGTYRGVVKATETDGPYLWVNTSATNAVVSAASCKEVTGIHATQATTGNKPKLRRGLVNLLTWSTDLTNAEWVVSGSASKVDSSHINFTASTSDKVTQATANGVSSVGEIWTQAVMLSGSGQVSLFIYDNGGAFPGTSSSQITLTATPTMYVVSRTHTDATTTSIACQIVNSSGTAATVTVGGCALFAGAYTADQILAAGGIPLTTTAPASSSVGAYAWEFDGVDDNLALSSVPFTWADDFTVVCCTNLSSLSSTTANDVFSIASNVDTLPLIKLGTLNTTGQAQFAIRDSAGTLGAVVSAGSAVDNKYHVISGRKVGAALTVGLDGAYTSITKVSTAVGSLTSAAIGWRPLAAPTNVTKGYVASVIAIKGTVTPAQLLTIERGLNALSNYAAGRF